LSFTSAARSLEHSIGPLPAAAWVCEATHGAAFRYRVPRTPLQACAVALALAAGQSDGRGSLEAAPEI
jgi:hypothetical protein